MLDDGRAFVARDHQLLARLQRNSGGLMVGIAHRNLKLFTGHVGGVRNVLPHHDRQALAGFHGMGEWLRGRGRGGSSCFFGLWLRRRGSLCAGAAAGSEQQRGR